MKHTTDYLRLNEEISEATRATDLHRLNIEVAHYGFSADELKTLRLKISERFCAINAAAVFNNGQPAPAGGRFTLLKHSKPSAIRRS
jgi:hypothetical protein